MKSRLSLLTMVPLLGALAFGLGCGDDGSPTGGGTGTDTTPPRLTSTTPAAGATNVPVGANLQLTFSEEIDQNTLEQVFLVPEVGEGTETWSSDGRTFTYDPDDDLMDDTQYSVVIPPGAVSDLAGNVTTETYRIVWSTGTNFESGGIRGTLSGDPLSASASDPTGAVVVAATDDPTGENDDFGIAGVGVVEANDDYAILNLPDDWYYPLAVLDSNGDGIVDPSTGDAIGLLGVDFMSDFSADSVEVLNGQTAIGANFGLFDPVSIHGTVAYNGMNTGGYTFWVGAFDTTGFDINNIGSPDAGTEQNWPNEPDYTLEQLDDGLEPGTYYIGAYLDVNFSGDFEPGTDPAGFYGGLTTPTPVTLAHGDDAFDVDITMFDPVTPVPKTGAPAASWARTKPGMDPRLQRAIALLRQSWEKLDKSQVAGAE